MSDIYQPSMSERSISKRIRLLFIGFTLMVSLFFALMIMAYSWLVEDNVFNRLVADEAAYIEQVFQQQGVIIQPQSRYMTLYSSWSALPQRIQLLQQQSPDRVEFPLADGGTLHLTTLQLGSQQMILAADVSRFEVSVDYLPAVVIWIIATLLIVSLLALYLAVRVSRIAVVPVQRLAKLVGEKRPDQGVRFAATFADDEIGYLARTIENSINQLQAAFAREKAFTRDVSHELRTPVTVLRMLDSQLVEAGDLPEKLRSDYRQSVQSIDHTVTVLLALAREETLQQEPLCLLAEIEDCVVHHHGLAQDEDFELHVDVDRAFRVKANKNLLQILLNNLLDNAVNHGSGNDLSIRLKDKRLSFVNSTNQSAPANVFAGQVKREQSQGLGQGLNLVQRICERSGWQVQASSDSQLFSLTLVFP